MLTIKMIEDVAITTAYFKQNRILHTPAAEQFMGMFDGNQLIGLGSLTLAGTKVYMNFIHTKHNDHQLNHGLSKALLNMADLRGIKTIYGSNPELENLYKILRFQKIDDEYTLSLEGYFTAEHSI